MPIVCSISKNKLAYIPPHKRNQKVERKDLKPKPPFRSQHKVLDGSKFVPTCHHCGVISHIRLQCPKLKIEQNHVVRSLSKKSSGPKHIGYHHCGAFGHLRPHCSKFQALKRIKRKEKFKLLGSCVIKAKLVLGKMVSCWRKFLMFLPLCLCASSILILPTFISLLMRQSFQTIIPFGWGRVHMVELLLFWSLIKFFRSL